MTAKLILLFKFIQPLFWLTQLWLMLNLADARGAFGTNLKVINWLIRRQGFMTQLIFEEKAFNIWRRDLWILFVLNLVVIVLIRLI